MAGKIRQYYVSDVATCINNFLTEGDRFTALDAEKTAFTAATPPLAVTQADVDIIYGTHEEGTDPDVVIVPNVTLAEFNQGYAAMLTMVNFMHQPAQANKVYRLKR